MKGRHSEVNDLNGTVVAEARRLGRSAPVNAAIVEMALDIEGGKLKPDPANISLLANRLREEIERWPKGLRRIEGDAVRAKNLIVLDERDGGMAAAQINCDRRSSHIKNESLRGH